ncbi:MAG: amino acid permease [Candidatus Aminicenantes bacterium]|nr:amino acid permease [Candidatus Aminicenantes bacterium]
MKSNRTPELRRAMGLPHATALVVGTIIGASIFVQPSEITGQVPSVPGVFLVWLIAGIMTIFGALVCAELSSIFTQSGGVYVFLRNTFNPASGFLWGWAMFWSMHSGIIAAIAMIFARYAAYFLPLGDFGIKVLAVVMIFMLSAINYIGVKQGSTLQTLFTLGKVMAIVAIIVIGFSLGSKVPEHFVTGSIETDVSLRNFFLAIVAGLFAFGGWHMVTYSAEETKNPRKTIPQALMLGTLIVTALYIALNAVYMYILPLDKVASSTRIAAEAADVLLGSGGGAVLSGIVMFSTFGAVSGIILAGPRVYYSMARDGLLFRWVGDIHPKYRTPHRAIIIQAIWSSVLVVTGTYRVLFTRVVYTEWIFFGLMTIGLFLLRRRPGIKRDYSIWGYPVVPALFVISSFIIVMNQIISDPGESLFGLSLVGLGLPVYYFWAKRKREES